MNPLHQEALIKLEKALKAIYDHHDTIPIDEEWQKKLMAHIRVISSQLPEVSNFVFSLELFLWRFVAVASAMSIIMLTFYFLKVDFLLEYEAARLFFSDPLQFFWIHYLEI